MASIKTKLAVGLFLIVGVSVAVVAIIWLGMSGYLEKGRYFSAYFDESVQGITKDSPVKYRGVYIGRVHSVQVAPDGNLIEVVMKIESEMDLEKTYKTSVARLKTVGITGLMFVELERKKENFPYFIPELDAKPEFPIIATRPSELSQLFKDFDDALKSIGELDLKQLSEKAIMTLTHLNETIDSANMAQLSLDLRRLIGKTETMMNAEKLENMLDSVKSSADRFEAVSDNADIAINDFKDTIAKINNVIDTGRVPLESALVEVDQVLKKMDIALEKSTSVMDTVDDAAYTLMRQARITLKGFDDTALKMNRLIENVSDQPSLLLFSEPAAPKAPE